MLPLIDPDYLIIEHDPDKLRAGGSAVVGVLGELQPRRPERRTHCPRNLCCHWLILII